MNWRKNTYRIAVASLLILVMSGFSYQELNYAIKNTTYQKGEKLTFRLHYGFLTGGYPVMQVFDKTYNVDGKTCYKMEVSGKSSGAIHKLFQIKDLWRSYVDTNTSLPKYAYRNISEGNYKIVENTYINRGTGKVKVVKEKEAGDQTKEYEATEGIHDIVSGFFYFRNIDYSKKSVGDKVTIKAFFDGELYTLNVVYKGKFELKTDFGKIDCYKLEPEVPENDLFNGDDSISFYLSADNNRLPIKIKANMFVGSVEMDLSNYENLKYPIKFK
jgi:hypothetical protein